jgi:hypothetical protein
MHDDTVGAGNVDARCPHRWCTHPHAPSFTVDLRRICHRQHRRPLVGDEQLDLLLWRWKMEAADGRL